MTSAQHNIHRVTALDVAKGIGISLVVFGHVLGGALARGWIAQPDGAEFVYKFIYSFHMPFFFILSGALAINHIQRDPFDAFISRCGSIAWPYFLWSAIVLAVQSYAAKFMLYPPSDVGAVASLWRVLLGETFWFLWALFICEVLLMATLFVPVIVLLCVSLLVAVVASRYDLGPFRNIVHFMPFVAFGAMIGGRLKRPLLSGRAASAVGAMALFGLTFTYVALHLEGRELSDWLVGVLGSVALLLLAYASASAPSPVSTRPMSMVGEASLAILLLHPYAQAAARMLITNFAGSYLPLQLVMPTLAGIVGPLLIWQLAVRLGFKWLFRLPLRSTITPFDRGAERDAKFAELTK